MKRGMILKIRVSGFEEVEKLSPMEERRELLGVSHLIFTKGMEGESENVMLRLVSRFKSLRYEDLEEVYSDGCLVLWNKMMDEKFKLEGKSMVGYLVRVCRNIGMHYLRKVNEDVESLDRIMERGCGKEYEDDGMKEFFDVAEEKSDENEIFEKLDKAWDKLKEVDRLILESYYVDGCRMEEIAKKVGYRNGNSVKSRKNRVLRKIMDIMQEGADFSDLPKAA